MPNDKMHQPPRRDKGDQGYLGRKGFSGKDVQRGFKKLGPAPKKK